MCHTRTPGGTPPHAEEEEIEVEKGHHKRKVQTGRRRIGTATLSTLTGGGSLTP